MRALEQQRRASGGDTLGAMASEQAQELEGFRRMLEDKKISEQQYATARLSLSDIMTNKIRSEAETERQILVQKLSGVTAAIERSLSAPLEDAFNGGLKSANEYFTSLLKGLSMALMQDLVLKPIMESITGGMTSGAPGAFMSSLFGGARAGGGPVAPGKAYLVGENGPEIMVPNLGGQVIPNGGGPGMSSRPSGSVVNIDARQADVGVVARVIEAMRALEAARPPAAVAVAAAAQRFPTRR